MGRRSRRRLRIGEQKRNEGLLPRRALVLKSSPASRGFYAPQREHVKHPMPPRP